MPSWSIRFEGALDDQQINDIVIYLWTLSSENVPPEENVCLNEDAHARRPSRRLDRRRQPEGPVMETCLGFNVDCGILAKGAGVTVMAFILFVGSVYLLLTAVLGRWMGYLVLMVAFSGWMIMLSALWAFGFYSQGPDTPVNLGPRGAEPAWIPLLASTGETSARYDGVPVLPGASRGRHRSRAKTPPRCSR